MRIVRVAAHVHSEWSDDAAWALADVAAAFARRRYDAVLMCEHDRGFSEAKWKAYRRACAEASLDGPLLVPGIEYQDGDNCVHLPVWGTDIDFLGGSRPSLETLEAAAAGGGVAVFAHPWRRGAIERWQPEWAPLLSAIEIWNRKYDGVAPNRASLELAERERLPAFVSLDFHNRRQFFPLAMTVQIDDRVATAALIEAIRVGRCRPESLGVSALRFTKGIEGRAAGVIEGARRGLARRVRSLEARGHR